MSDLIVSHQNADFDAFSSLVAAKKLYPDAKLLLPGSHERAVREFLTLVKDEICIEDEKTCDFRGVKRLILVDTRHRSRIGKAAEVLNNPSVEVHIYDHHPRTSSDIKGDRDIFQEVGATVTILIDILRKSRKFKMTPLEATMMLLAIYEETGSLTYRTTTSLDVDTVSFLLSKGANLGAVSSYLNRKLTEEELTFLTMLLGSTRVVNINGINVAIAEGTIKRFIGELGTIVRKLEDVENLPVLFAIFRIGKHLRVIARSRLKEVDVNKILKHFAGGGHRSAASAKIKDMDSKAFRERLIKILKSGIKVKIFASDIMTSPVKTIKSGSKIKEAMSALLKYGLKGAPVMSKNKLIGMITMSDIRKAMRYKYGHASVKGYMRSAVKTIKPDTPLHVIQGTMFENNIGRLPVLKRNRVVGIVTRTDVLKSVHRDIFRKHSVFKRRKTRFNISAKLKKVLPRQILGILHTIGRVAGKSGCRAFVVGGFVRDIILGVRNFDLDIVVEGDAISFGRKIADLYGGSHVEYRKFGTSTAVIDWPRGLRKPEGAPPRFKIDFATARRESYEKPAALPTVEFSSLKDDLQRRDFTMNAMAASLNRQSFGQLIDFFGGEKDLENGVIRVLHDASFIDDPTRIFRAVRFEQRFGFRLDRYTEDLIKHAIREGMFSKTQNQRIRDELILMMMEDEPIRAILRMKELHELRFIHRKIKVNGARKRLFADIKKTCSWYDKSPFRRRHIDRWLIYMMAFLDDLTPADIKGFSERFVFRKGDRTRLISRKKNAQKIMNTLSAKKLMPSAVYAALCRLSFEEILFIKAKAGKRLVSLRIKNFLAKYEGVKIRTGGEDLKKLGLAPGPLYTRLLVRVLYARIDGWLKTKREEIGFIKKRLGKNI